jgi:GGDEF domain-containing protein
MADEVKKVEPELAEALAHVRTAMKAGAVDPEHFKNITRAIFSDSMVPGMGNKRAYADFLTRPRQGVHVRMDANDFGDINKVHGFEVGNEAISALGRAIHESLHETAGSKRAKAFRIGGDEFHAHVPDARTAARFTRRVREKLEAIPPVRGTHSLSLSVGFGHTPEHAEQATIHAKTAKKAAGYAKGKANTHAHSLVPGFEGAVPVSKGPKLPIPAPAAPAVAPALASE